MRPSPLLIVAVTLNVALAATLVFSWHSNTQGSGAPAGPADLSAVGLPGGSAEEDPAKLFAWARQQGVSDEIAYRLALVAARATTAITVPDEYWRPAPERSAALREADYKSIQATRELLLQNFGPAAKEQPAFAEVFQPYRQRLPFLSAKKQMALQQILFETSNGEPAFIGPESGASDQRSARIRALLSEKEFAEYQRRESPIAVRLANNGFEFTEAEFRAVYDAVAATGQRLAGPQPYLAGMPAIERVLGTGRFLEFKRVQDPIYRWLRSGAKKFGVAQDAIAAAYELIKTTEKRAAEIGNNPRHVANIAQARADIFAARDRELKTKLGAEMFGYIAPRLESSGGPRSGWPGNPATAFIPAR